MRVKWVEKRGWEVRRGEEKKWEEAS